MLDTLRQAVPIAISDASLPSARRSSRSGTRSTLTNVVLYQAGWFGCVLAAAADRPLLATGAALAAAAIHLLLVMDRLRVLAVLAVAGLTGLLVDTITVRLGILQYAAPLGWDGLAPLWIVALWVQFGMTLGYCFGWLSGRYGLAALLGLIGGPLSFAAGARLGAAEIPEPAFASLAALGLLWAVALPFLVGVADRLLAAKHRRGLYRFESAGPAGGLAAS